ncbi:MAG: translation initiation factor IF-2 N-terminal domain-containing protein, partial [Actinomycetales bacterium]
MAKVRVYELAKEIGMESKDVLAKLQEMGEFVRSASSTVEPPVVRKFLEKYPPVNKPTVEKVTKKAPAKKAAPKKSEPAVEEVAQATETTTPPISETPKPVPGIPSIPKPPAARPGNNPFGTSGGIPRPPRPAARPGNNPFGTSGSTGKPTRPGAPQRGPLAGPRPGSVRPGFAARPQRPDQRTDRPGAPRTAPGRGGAPTPYRNQPAQRPGGPGARPGFGGPSRPGGARPGAGGAFGKGGGKKKSYKSKKALREEIDNMEAPTIGGAIVPRGDGNTPVKLRRGASLADFAEKIGAYPAALVSVLFHLGEMVTAT